jgi:hypothetical protein
VFPFHVAPAKEIHLRIITIDKLTRRPSQAGIIEDVAK